MNFRFCLPIIALIGMMQMSCSETGESSTSTNGNDSSTKTGPSVSNLEDDENKADSRPRKVTDHSPVILSCFEQANEENGGVPACMEKYRKEINQLTPNMVDKLFVAAKRRLEEMTQEVNVQLSYETAFDEDFNWKKEAIQPYTRLGLMPDSEEGMFFLKINTDFLHNAFDGKVSSGLQAYLDYLNEHPLKISYDAGLILSPDEYAERVLTQEEILLTYESFPGREDLIERFLFDITWFYTGMDNTPAFDYINEQKAYPEWKEAWQKVAEEGGEVLAPITQRWLRLIAENEDRRPEVNAFEFIDEASVKQKLN